MKKAKKTKVDTGETGENMGKKKKGGKKKLLLIPIALVLVAAIAAAVVIFVLPRFGINLIGGDDSPKVEEPLPKKGVQEYSVGENIVASLDTVLDEEGSEGELLAMRSPGKKAEEVDNRFTYIYELNSFAAVMDRYLDFLLDSEQGFFLTDETYLVLEERPELQDVEGALILARPAGEEEHVFQLVIGWSQASNILAVRVSAPEGAITHPKKEKPENNRIEPSNVSTQLSQLRDMEPAHLGLPGNSMDEYTIFPVDGFVKVNEQDCRRFNVYEKDKPGSIAGTYLFSVDGEHIYILNPNSHQVSTIR